MDITTGKTYPDREAALNAGVHPLNLVEVSGPEQAIKRLPGRVRMAAKFEFERRRKRQKAQKASRLANARRK